MSGDESNGATAAANDDDRKLFAGGLPQEAAEADIKEYFAQFGTVASVNLKMDQMTGRSRGFAFIVFEEQGSLDNVLGQEHAIKGKKVAVKKATSKQGKIYVGKFTEPITEDEIKEHFSQFGTIVEIQRPVDRSKNNEPKNFCFVTFDKEEPADSLLKQGKVQLGSQEVEIKKVMVKSDGGMKGGRGGMRGGMRGGGGWGGGGMGYDAGWGYGGGAGWGDYGPAAGGWGYGGYGGYGAWDGGYGGGGKMGGMNAGGGGYGGGGRGSKGGRGGRSAPY